jgi:hypothetical protein
MSDTINNDLTFISKTKSSLRHINYAVTAHGTFENFFILPKNVRVIMKCTFDVLITDGIHQINFFKIMLNNLGDNLENMMNIEYDKSNSMCVFDGDNIHIPNIIFSPNHNEGFIDGIFELPLNVSIESNIGNTSISANSKKVLDDLNTINNEEDIGSKYFDKNIINYGLPLMELGYRKFKNIKVNYLSEYISFHKTNLNSNGNIQSVETTKNTTLENLINYIKKKSNFNVNNDIITIFLSTCTEPKGVYTSYKGVWSEFGVNLNEYIHLKKKIPSINNHNPFFSFNPSALAFNPITSTLNPNAREFSFKSGDIYYKKYIKYKTKYLNLIKKN